VARTLHNKLVYGKRKAGYSLARRPEGPQGQDDGAGRSRLVRQRAERDAQGPDAVRVRRNAGLVLGRMAQRQVHEDMRVLQGLRPPFRTARAGAG